MLHLKVLLVIDPLLGNYALCLVSPQWLTLCPSKSSTLGKFFLLGVILDESSYHFSIILVTFHTSSFLHPHLLGFLGVLTQEGIVPHFMGRRG